MKRKALAWIVTLFLFLSFTFSFGYIADNMHHHCSGEDCQVCAQIDVAVHLLSSVKYVPILSACLALLCVFTQYVFSAFHFEAEDDTLITLKVELLD